MLQTIYEATVMQPETHNPINSAAPAEGTPFPEPLATAALLPIHPMIERGLQLFV
jgi:hypothetical protein